MATRTGVKEAAQPGSILLVVHDFVARSEDELSLAKGDRLELIERDDDFGDGWFLGRHMNSAKTGLFPEVYTTPAPRGTLTNTAQARRTSDLTPKTPISPDGPVASQSTHERHSSGPAFSARPVSSSAVQQSMPSMAQPGLRTSIPPAISTTRSDAMSTASPVMNETLSVIDEHMNDMNTPPGSFTNGNKRNSTGGSMYSAQPVGRMSYIQGQETDDEANHLHTEEEVLQWTPDRVAEYLEDNGVEKSHCDVFKEQEISGEVLLAMEQSSLFLKEFELGSVGRRLKTWHKVRALQDEIQASKSPAAPRSVPDYRAVPDDDMGDAARNRASTMGSAFPRALETSRQSGVAPSRSSTVQSTSHPTQQNATSPLQSMTSTSRAENTYRPSAQVIREMQHSRRHSSIDSTNNSIDGGNGSRQSHRKHPSLDRTWQPGQPLTNGQSVGHSHTLSAESAAPSSDLPTPSSPNEMERGYFSSNDADARSKSNKKLTKKTSAAAGHSRNGDISNRRSTTSGRVTSGDFLRDSVGPVIGTASPAAAEGIFGALNSVGQPFGSMRSATAPTRSKPMTQTTGASPIVTKLDGGDRSQLSESPGNVDDSSGAKATSPIASKLPFFASNKPKVTGLRTISDAITRNEKSMSKDGDMGSPARTGSTTPSTDTRSFDMQKSEAQLGGAGSGNNLLPPQSQRRNRPKTKKSTSAYTRGLEKKTPVEQMIGCDYSGWMKKKSGSLMTTWKTRLFILRGRRLSYYYSDGDTEEKGLIDISFHRVLPAHNEALTGLHAAVTGAAASPSSPRDNQTVTTNAEQDLKNNPSVGETGDGIFIFKLIPPKSGLSKGVNFTKPTVHYFAVNSRQEGRLWMAALMKATIDRDDDSQVTTTYNQKTVSLATARARRERPPALRESDNEDRPDLDADEESNKGLGIGGLSEKGDTVAGAEDASSMAPSTTATGGVDSVNEKSETASNTTAG